MGQFDRGTKPDKGTGWTEKRLTRETGLTDLTNSPPWDRYNRHVAYKGAFVTSGQI